MNLANCFRILASNITFFSYYCEIAEPVRMRLFILATWLHREGICQPEDLLGKDFSRYRRKALRGSSRAPVYHRLTPGIYRQYLGALLRAAATRTTQRARPAAVGI